MSLSCTRVIAPLLNVVLVFVTYMSIGIYIPVTPKYAYKCLMYAIHVFTEVYPPISLQEYSHLCRTYVHTQLLYVSGCVCVSQYTCTS